MRWRATAAVKTTGGAAGTDAPARTGAPGAVIDESGFPTCEPARNGGAASPTGGPGESDATVRTGAERPACSPDEPAQNPAHERRFVAVTVARIVQAFTAGEPARSSTDTGESPSRESSESSASKDTIDPGERGSSVTTTT